MMLWKPGSPWRCRCWKATVATVPLLLVLYGLAYWNYVRGLPSVYCPKDGNVPVIRSRWAEREVAEVLKRRNGRSNPEIEGFGPACYVAQYAYRGAWHIFDPILVLDQYVLRPGYWGVYFSGEWCVVKTPQGREILYLPPVGLFYSDQNALFGPLFELDLEMPPIIDDDDDD